MSDSWLQEAAAGDVLRLQQLRDRVAAGEPSAYVAGFMRFRSRRFRIDARGYVTDPEATHLVDLVLALGDELEQLRACPPRLLEFGVGAGTLSISLALERPHWPLIGLDVDPLALTLAAENAALHGVRLTLICSDQLAGWPETLPAPDLVFGDPPWGGEEDLYGDAERDAAYYHQMPAASAYPGAGRTAIHDELIRQLVVRDWPCQVVLNYGVLPPEVIARSTAPLGASQIREPTPGTSVLVGQVRAQDTEERVASTGDRNTGP